MNEEKKGQLRIKFGDPALDYSGHKTIWYVKDNVKLDDVILWIDSELKQARIDENKRNLDMFLSLPDSQFTDLEIGVILRNRIEEIKKKKELK